MAAMLAGCLQAGTLDDIRALEAGKTAAPPCNGRSQPAGEQGDTDNRPCRSGYVTGLVYAE